MCNTRSFNAICKGFYTPVNILTKPKSDTDKSLYVSPDLSEIDVNEIKRKVDF